MSIGAWVLTGSLVPLTSVSFYGLGRVLKRNWKFLGFVPVALIIAATFLYHQSDVAVTNTPTCNPAQTFCGWFDVGPGFIWLKYTVVCAVGAVLTLLIGLPSAWYGARRRRLILKRGGKPGKQ
jgi:hypothetical protein